MRCTLQIVYIRVIAIKINAYFLCRDTAGQEKYRSVTTSYYRGAKGVIIAYDITNRKSFENISNWMTNFKRVSNTH